MMVSDMLKVSLATNHPPLNKVSSVISKKLLQNKLRICYSSLKHDFAVSNPKVGVLSLNPHAGDGGVIGNEEKDVISPALKELRRTHGASSFNGPFAADAYFAASMHNRFDLTFALYHDQGLIPFKMIAGMKGINYTAGLSFVRTSPDHGTAFDIAGKNKAAPVSFIEAIKWADRIYKNKLK
jgi:4-hydroxythreonine-4-phosphate dehydrogenase